MKKIYGFLRVIVVILSAAVLTAGWAGTGVAQSAKGANASAEDGPASGAFIAAVDISVVYALHPLMQYFDQNTGYFIKPPKQAVSHQEFLNIIKTRSGDFKQSAEGNSSEIKRLKAEIETLVKEIEKLENYKITEAGSINEKYDALLKSAEPAQQAALNTQRAGELDKVEKKFSGDIGDKNKKLSALLDSQEKLQRSMLKSYYLSPEETAKKFEEINAEIGEAIKAAAKKNGVKAVINLNLLMPAKSEKSAAEKNIEDKTKINSTLEYLIANGPDYSKILGALRTFEAGMSKEIISTRDKQYSESEYIKMLQKMQKDQEIESAKNSFFTKEYISGLKPVRKFASNPIVYGGVDITEAVIVPLMVKHGVPAEKARALYEAVTGGVN